MMDSPAWFDVAPGVYDCDEAAQLIANDVGISVDDALTILREKDLYELGLELWSDDDGYTADEVRALAPELFPAECIRDRYLSPLLQREFITRRTPFGAETVSLAINADEKYMRRLVIIVDVPESPVRMMGDLSYGLD